MNNKTSILKKYTSQRERVNTILKFAGKNKKILELGTGDGGITKYLKKENKVTTCDATNKADVKHNFNKFPYPFKNKSFDVIVLAEVLEHLSFPVNCLKECSRIIKDNGKIIITVPNIASFKNIISILFLGKLTYTAEPEIKFGHVCDYWISRLNEIVHRSELKINRWETTSSYMKYFSITIPKWLYPKRLGEFIIAESVKKQ